ncbi:MAG: B12-binding domain-containing radical SAM protein [Candidatus Helarchaeota archaeon]
MRILLVNPMTRNYSKGITIAAAAPLGLLSLAAILRENGHKVKIFDHNVENNGLKQHLKFEPDLVGITSFTGIMIKDALKISEIFHERGIPVVWGGIHASLLPEQTVKDPRIDIVVVGEGEETLLELANNIESNKTIEDVKGVVWKKNSNGHQKIIKNKPRDFIEDLDSLPFPAWDLIDGKKYLNTMRGWESSSSEFFSIQTSRGCPFRCAFCYNTVFNKRRWRYKSADRVVEEISFLKEKYNITRINIRDDNFVVNKKRAIEICKKIYNNKLDINFGIDCRVDLISNELARYLKFGGCDQIYFGIESGSPRMLKFIKKDINLAQAYDAIKLCKQLKIKNSASFIIGLPNETEKDVMLTEKFIFQCMPDNLLVKIFVPFPGTELYNYVVNRNQFSPPTELENWALDWMNVDFKVSELEPKILKNILRKIYMKHFIMKLPKFLFNIFVDNFKRNSSFHKIIYYGLQNIINAN